MEIFLVKFKSQHGKNYIKVRPLLVRHLLRKRLLFSALPAFYVYRPVHLSSFSGTHWLFPMSDLTTVDDYAKDGRLGAA